MTSQAGLFSAVLTAFIIDSKQNLTVNPQDQMVYYLQQNVVLLDQISRQILSIAPQVPITAPLPFPSFKPLEIDIRVNVFFFMALIFSLAAALLAILIQQWVRDYMQVFQRYSDPLKCARVRQYLHDGLERWHMPVVAKAVPGLLHVSLFLFLAGFCVFVLNINTTVGISTTVPIGISGLLYIFATFIPIIRPQSPYQNSFSAIIWSVMQTLGGRKYRDWVPDGERKPVSWNMVQGRMQLAMEETGKRNGRDEEAIRWLIGNMTEDAEMESFVMAIPGSFNGEWGLRVWKNISNAIEDKSTSRHQHVVAPPTDTNTHTATPPVDDSHTDPMAVLPRSDPPNVRLGSATAHIQGENTMRELNIRVAHLLETCKNRDVFARQDLWQRRTRGCVETVVSLVCCAGVKLDQFGEIVKLLGDIGVEQKIQQSTVGMDQMFVMRWTCLSLVAIQPILASDRGLQDHADLAISSLTDVRHHAGDEQTPTHIVGTFYNALECLRELSGALPFVGNTEEQEARKVLLNQESLISKLERIGAQDVDSADEWIQAVQRDVERTTHGIILQLPGINFDDTGMEPVHLNQLKELYRDCHKFPFIFPSHNLKSIREVTHTFRNILNGNWDDVAFKKVTKALREMFSSVASDNPLRREVWRLQDLHEGGGLGFTVELFFLTLRQLLSTSSSKESHSALLIGTFRAVTSDWSKYKNSPGTQKLLLDWAVSDNGIFVDSANAYPDFLIDEFLVFLAKVLEGQAGQHIDAIVHQLNQKSGFFTGRRALYYKKVLRVIPQASAQGPSS